MLRSALVCKGFDFPAAHKNNSDDGHCSNIHGHTWYLEVFAWGDIVTDKSSPEYGMVMSFTRIKQIYKEKIEPFVEHQYLNQTLPILEEFTTEIIGGWILSEMRRVDTRIKYVRLWEGKSSFAEVHYNDLTWETS